MLVVHATRALHYRMPTTPATSDDVSTTALGAWYATPLPWRRPTALLVNHTTLLPLLMPLTPAATLQYKVSSSMAPLFNDSRHPDLLLITLPPFPMHAALLRSQYYGGSATPRCPQRASHLPTTPPDA